MGVVRAESCGEIFMSDTAPKNSRKSFRAVKFTPLFFPCGRVLGGEWLD